MGEYQQGYDPKSLWDATLLETLWGMAVALFFYLVMPGFLIWSFYKLFVQ